MSSKNRREQLAKQNIFNPSEQTQPVTFQQTDSQIFGEIAKRDDAKVTAPAVPIGEIYPNNIQPRRALPSVIRALWDGDPKTLGDLFSTWQDRVNEERQAQGATELFDVRRLLLMEDSKNTSEEGQQYVGPLEETFLEIINLAANIHRNGLMNPITAAHVRSEGTYLLETGERRWLAYHLLATVFPKEEQWRRIPTRTVEKISVWRQASENTARQDLNAVGKARQYAVLMMDLLVQETDSVFYPVDEFSHERQFYAQVLATDKTPYGKRELLLNAMGLKSPAELNRCRKILALPDSVWTVADDLNTAQAVLLHCEGRSEAEALRIVSSWNDSEVVDAEEQQQGAETQEAKITPSNADELVDDIERNLARVNKTMTKTFSRLQKSGSVTPERREQLQAFLEDHERLISDIKNWLES